MSKLLLVLAHHVETVTEVGEPRTKMHLVLELLEDLIVVEVGVRKETVKAARNVVQVLLRVGRDRDSVEVRRVDDRCGVVQCVNHVVHRSAVRLASLGARRRCADIDELFATSHARACFSIADAQKLHHEQVEL